MKRYTFVFSALLLSLLSYSQMRVKKPNFYSFNTDKKVSSALLDKLSSAQAKQHPEYGVVPYNTQCTECVELLDKRTVDARQYIDPYDEGHTYSQKSYFPLHYKKSKNDIWRTIDFRLRPDAANPGVYAANNQPLPTKLDLNNHSSSIIVGDLQFDFNHHLSRYFFDENSAYSSPVPAAYTKQNVGEEGLEVVNIWDGINMEETFRDGRVKTNFVLNAPIQIPIAKGWMVIEDRFTLPEGYSVIESKTGEHDGKFFGGDYLIVDKEKNVYVTCERPSFVDAMAWGVKGNYQLEKTGNEYTLKLFVPISWLTRSDNTYPLFIDPLFYGNQLRGAFTSTGNVQESFGFTTKPASCDYHIYDVNVPGKSRLTNAWVDLEYRLQFDPTCGTPPLPSPFCTFSQVTQEIICDSCGTTSGNLVCNPAAAPYTGTCTTDSNLVPGANSIRITSYFPGYLGCYQPQCPDYLIDFTLKNRDSTCNDACGWLCAMGYLWQMTIEACRIDVNITPANTAVCAGQPVTLTAHPSCGVPPYNHFDWSTDGGNTYDTVYNTPNFTFIPSQETFVICIAHDACDYPSPQSNLSDVIVNPSPPASAGNDLHLCAGGPLVIGGSPTTNPGVAVIWTGETGLVQSWLNSTTIQNPTANIPVGTIDTFFYVVRATALGCFRTDTVLVFSSPIPTADAGNDAVLCGGGTILLGGNPASNAASVLWSSETPTMESWLSSTSVTNPQATVPAGTVDTFFYALTATTGNCVAHDTMLVFSNPTPSAVAGNDTSLCEGGTVFLGGNPTTSNGATILWSGENVTVEGYLNGTNVANPQATVPAGTVDTFFYVVTTSIAACSTTDTMVVFSNRVPFADAGNDVILCEGGVVLLGATPSNNAATVVWSGETATVEGWLNITSASNPQATVPAGTVNTFFYALTAANGSCVATDTMTVFSKAIPVANAGADVVLCEGGTVNLGGNPSAPAGASVLWSGENPMVEGWLSSTSTGNPQAFVPPGTIDTFFYALKAFDPDCFSSDTMTVFSAANPVSLIDTSGSTQICSNQSVTISSVGNYASYEWNTGSTASSIQASQSGQYYVVVTDANGCKDTSNIVIVNSVPTPTVQVYPDTLIMYGDSVMLYTDINLSSASIDSFRWYPTMNISCTQCNNPYVAPDVAAQYYGVNVYANGCSATDSALIRVIFPNNFFIPNAFTPNGDGNNDNFYIQAQSGVKVILFQVFNRWGEKMHEGSYPWDGIYRTKPAPAGVYIYIFKLGLFGDDIGLFRKGSVTLIR